MDERELDIDLITGAKLPAVDYVYRRAQITSRDRENKAIPAIRNFHLSDSDNFRLSVDYDKFTTPEQSIARIGAEFRYKKSSELPDEYKDYTNWELYQLSISFLNSLESVIDVVYDPVQYSPRIKGKPDNPAHSLILIKENFEEDEPEFYAIVREHAQNQRIEIDIQEVDKLVKELRELDKRI